MESKPIVTITGISGYVGSQVCLHFLKCGQFKVRGTVRSKTNTIKIQPLKDAFGELFDEIELVEADLLNENSLFQAIEGSTYVVHTASPFPIAAPKNEDELIKPALEGTTAVLKACHQNKVKRLVITSSIAAIMVNDKEGTYTVDDWSDLEKCQPYEKSKTVAERAAWEFQKKFKEEHDLEIVTINPGLVMGPNLNKAQFSSGDIVKRVMMNDLPGMPKVQMPSVDVRDVAKAHLNAILIPEAANQRFILCSESCWFKDYGQWLDEVYGKQGSKKYKVVNKELPKLLCTIVAFFDKELATIMPFWGKEKSFETTTTKEILKIDFIPIRKSIQDMAVTLIETGYIPDKR